MAEIRLLELRNTYKWGGGPDKTILLSAERHDAAKVDVVVAYIRGADDREFCIADKARARGLTFYEIIEQGKLDLRVLRALRRIVLKHKINVIHAHDYKSDLFAYLLRRWSPRQPFVVMSTMHGWALLGLRGRLYWSLDLFLMRRFDHLIAVSHSTRDELVTAGIPPGLVSVLHNAIDTDAWSQSRVTETLRDELGLDPSCPVIGYVGRITPEKDLDTWLRTAGVVAQSYPNAQFVLVGDGRDGELSRQLQKLATELGIAEQLHFLGYRENLLPVYAAFDLFVLSSRREGICNSLLEAMAMALPVVATDAGGNGELVIDGQTGYIVPRGDAYGLARAVTTLLGHEQLRQSMGRSGRERVEREFSFTHRLRRIEELYARLLDLPSDHHTPQTKPVSTPPCRYSPPSLSISSLSPVSQSPVRSTEAK